jgi:hypothetical protein
VASELVERKPGQFAEERFRARRRAWLRRIWWALPLGALSEIGLFAGLGAVFAPRHMSFFWGLGIGVGVTMAAILADSPPHHIERWRQGADGEKATARALRRLTRNGWVVVHDLDRRRGNIDHVLVGPPGIFLLDSKDLFGAVSVTGGRLSVRWREDPGDGYENRSMAPRIRVAAIELERALRDGGIRQHRVQPVVVLWARFEQRSIMSGEVAWVRGKDLAKVLEQRPAQLSPAELDEVAAFLRVTAAVA